MQHYGLANVWQTGDFVTRGILGVLMLMSVLSWTVMIFKLFAFMRIRRASGRTDAQFWRAPSFAQALGNLRELAERAPETAARDNPLLALALAGAEVVQQRPTQTQTQAQDRAELSEWITRRLQHSMDDTMARLQSGLAVLASIGSTAPFVGLFGTVWGIYHALIVIGETGQTSIDHVAGPVGESLIMTAFGLFVAIPAVLGYNGLTRANRTIATRLKRFAHGLHAAFVTGAPWPASAVRDAATRHPARDTGSHVKSNADENASANESEGMSESANTGALGWQ
ncbi:MotA/TolQ/ExbB proton channel family protein [Paraburkholderia unamae]|uniref:Biopolymer transport protein ExbB n=1 Tax=Paraburkholderia unamae TaxID=219649 RepID=A0ABX5KFN8_9BURK|nr:MotA/TolQ/ExbB proton channel family protein [Paraburkholderia unamae]PVX77082.1 outer membrane transport energization protein ExbB [Paraburkholderia unamae]CAG9269657.1 MotA/TolQ/ExbB proton channel family protein [Paraburkholderia unamae]